MRARKLFVLPGLVAIVLAAAPAPRLSHAAIYPHSGGAGSLPSSCEVDVWSVVPSASPSTSANQLLGVAAISSHDVWAVGYTADTNGPNLPLVEHGNGFQWTAVSVPDPSDVGAKLHAVAATSSEDVWAVGSYNATQSSQDTLIEHWNGTAWKLVASPNVSGEQDSVLLGITALSPTSAWAVGYSDDPTTLAQHVLTEHWNGAS